jgi:hypothetical protein
MQATGKAGEGAAYRTDDAWRRMGGNPGTRGNPGTVYVTRGRGECRLSARLWTPAGEAPVSASGRQQTLDASRSGQSGETSGSTATGARVARFAPTPDGRWLGGVGETACPFATGSPRQTGAAPAEDSLRPATLIMDTTHPTERGSQGFRLAATDPGNASGNATFGWIVRRSPKAQSRRCARGQTADEAIGWTGASPTCAKPEQNRGQTRMALT